MRTFLKLRPLFALLLVLLYAMPALADLAPRPPHPPRPAQPPPPAPVSLEVSPAPEADELELALHTPSPCDYDIRLYRDDPGASAKPVATTRDSVNEIQGARLGLRLPFAPPEGISRWRLTADLVLHETTRTAFGRKLTGTSRTEHLVRILRVHRDRDRLHIHTIRQ